MRLLRTLILSLSVHGLLALALTYFPFEPPHRRATVMDWVETTTPKKNANFEKELKDARQFIPSAPAPPELITNKKKPARFESRDDQTVIEEQRAAVTGATANRSLLGTKKNSIDFSPQALSKETIRRELAPTEAKQGRETMTGIGEGDVRMGGIEKPKESGRRNTVHANESQPLELPNFMGAEKGTSKIGDDLPSDMKVGDFTALNTDRNLYYTFYSRLESAIRPPWVRYVRASLYAYQTGALKLNGNEKWTTKAEFLLDKDGNFVKGIIHDGSSIASLDLASIRAFRDAKQFPHPPPEMVREDGFIHLMFQFSVYVDPSYASGGEE
jgi:hypothetical protein